MKTKIEAGLEKAADADEFHEGAVHLLKILGYESNRRGPEAFTSAEFVTGFNNRHSNRPEDAPPTLSEIRFLEHVESVRILFQMGNDDVEFAAENREHPNTRLFNPLEKSVFFAAVELKGETYKRREYAEFTREIDTRLPIATVALFRTNSKPRRVSIALADRRERINDPIGRPVLGRVSLLREINPDNMRSDAEILEDMALSNRLEWMKAEGKPSNYDGLLDAWLNTLDTETLNKNFYNDLKSWFDRVVNTATFPKSQPPQEHTVRLITRMLFIWFMKEKGLVNESLFIEPQIRHLLEKYNSETGDSYYRAVLQNLFFATLNTPIQQRKFREQEDVGNWYNERHRVSNLYRYEDLMANRDALTKLFAETPFINGELFDCLDDFEGVKAGGKRVDCFTDHPPHRKQLSVPNRLFFDKNGLIPLFNKYKFTLDESTPIEQEVALDPELLGNVFEKLLETYNAESGKTRRKTTGSFYTPRPIVDFMARESIAASLAQNVSPDPDNIDNWAKKMRLLLDEEADWDNAKDFSDEEKERIVRGISNLKILDPAVGSGAFPMAALLKLTLALRRLDPKNKLWEKHQLERAGDEAEYVIDRRLEREPYHDEMDDIRAAFLKYQDSNYGRKLFLIQNNIFGVDIERVACQIAKLRFFITLAIEQNSKGSREENYNIKPLPNLETRFINADTLQPLSLQGVLLSDRAKQIVEIDLVKNRERHCLVSYRPKKQDLEDKDENLRIELASELESSGMDRTDAQKVAQWNPYDQTAEKADWFSPVFMFGVGGGFDVVIGNPPYGQVKKGTYPKERFPYSEGMDSGKQNLYKLFVEQSYNLAKDGGVATLIVANPLMCDLSSAATRKLLLDHTQLKHIIEFPETASSKAKQVFKSVTQATCIYQFRKQPPVDDPIQISVGNDVESLSDLSFEAITRETILDLYPEQNCFPFIRKGALRVLQKIAGNKELLTLAKCAKETRQGDLNLTTHSKRFSKNRTPIRLIRGDHIERYLVRYNEADEYCENGFMAEKVDANRSNAYLICQQVANMNKSRRLSFALTDAIPFDYLCGNTINKLLLTEPEKSKFILGLLNSKFMDWLFRLTSSNNHVLISQIERLPIPAPTPEVESALVLLVDAILSKKASDPGADVSRLEEKIDGMVYDLYGLTEEERAVVSVG